MTEKIENQTLQATFELVDTLTQGIFERFEGALIKDKAEGAGVKTLYGKYLRAAIKVGWVISPKYTDEEIAALDPRIVALIGKKLVAEYNEAAIIPNA
jgi:hypothetical protein